MNFLDLTNTIFSMYFLSSKKKKKSYLSTQISGLIPINLMLGLSIELSSERENNTVDGTHVYSPIQIRHWQIHHPTMTPHSSYMHCTQCYLFFSFFFFFFWMMQEICCPYFLNILRVHTSWHVQLYNLQRVKDP